MKRVCLVLAVFGLSLVVLAPGAGAHNKRIASENTATFTDNEPVIPIVFPDDPDVFAGKVASAKDECVGGRTVHILKKRGEEILGIAAVAKTKDDGAWTVNKEDPTPGTYIARVTKELLPKAGHKHICQPADSAEMTIE